MKQSAIGRSFERDFLSNLFNELNSKQIPYSVLRNFDQLPNSTGGSDLDIWIQKDYVAECCEALNISAKRSGMIPTTFYSDDTAIKVGYQNEASGIQIDLFKGAIYYKHKILISESCILAETKYLNGISVLDKNFGDLLALLKELLNNGKIKDKYVYPIYNKKNIYTKEYLIKMLPNFGFDFISLFYKSINNGTIKEYEKKLYKLGTHTLSNQDELNMFRLLVSKIKRFFLKNPGYVFAIEGTDGSGKSFIINSITPILNDSFHNGIIYNHLRPHYIPDIAELFGKRKNNSKESKKVVSNPHAEKPAGLIESLIRWSYYMIDYTWGYLRKVWLPIHSKSKVFIFDRYYYEYYLDQRRSHVKLPMWIIRFGEFFVPKPDLILCLGGDPEKIYARKPETSLQEVTRQTRALKDFCSKRKKAVWIDTTVAPEESINAAMKAIIDMMSKRFNFNDLK